MTNHHLVRFNPVITKVCDIKMPYKWDCGNPEKAVPLHRDF